MSLKMLEILEARRIQIDEMHRHLIHSIQTQEEDDIYTVLDRTSIQYPVSAVVLNFLLYKSMRLVARTYLTQVIKQELFARTIPDYKPPTLQQQLSDILDIDLDSLSDKQANYLYNQLTYHYYDVEFELFDYDDTDGFYDDYGFYSLAQRLYSFDLTTLRFQFAARLKKELLLKE